MYSVFLTCYCCMLFTMKKNFLRYIFVTLIPTEHFRQKGCSSAFMNKEFYAGKS